MGEVWSRKRKTIENSLEEIIVQTSIKIAGCVLAAIGVACAVKYIMNHKESLCSDGWSKIKVKGEEPAGSTASNNVKAEDERLHGTRYGSNPVRY